MEKQRIYGLDNEDKIITYLNKKLISELDQKWKEHILKMFPDKTEASQLNVYHYPDKSAKADMMIEIDGEIKYVSIKTGKNPSIHHESYHAFQRFLKRAGVSVRTLQIIRFFHYGDSKKLKTGNNPLSLDEMKERYSSYFLEASKSLDEDSVISAVIKRTVLRGTNPGRPSIDFMYFGDLEHGKMISSDEICQIIFANREHGKSSIHFGGLNYMPNSRKVNDRERNYVRIKWPLLSFLYYCDDSDIEKMKKGEFKGLEEK